MSLYKQLKDQVIRVMLGKSAVPSGLAELNHYFRVYGPINFRFEKQEDGFFIAVSENFRYGSVITRAESMAELDEKVKDAILTAFEVPSSYAKEAGVHRDEQQKYAFA
ncbi:MAG: hypothetical protein AAB562_01675 [Patescibacteria group bacterium]